MSIVADIIDFSTWLQTEMDEREWTQAELSRRSGIDRQLISMYIKRKVTTPDKKSLTLIASAFKIPVEQVYRAAGLLPTSKEDPWVEEMKHKLEQLNPELRSVAEDIIEAIYKNEKRGVGKKR